MTPLTSAHLEEPDDVDGRCKLPHGIQVSPESLEHSLHLAASCLAIIQLDPYMLLWGWRGKGPGQRKTVLVGPI